MEYQCYGVVFLLHSFIYQISCHIYFNFFRPWFHKFPFHFSLNYRPYHCSLRSSISSKMTFWTFIIYLIFVLLILSSRDFLEFLLQKFPVALILSCLLFVIKVPNPYNINSWLLRSEISIDFHPISTCEPWVSRREL